MMTESKSAQPQLPPLTPNEADWQKAHECNEEGNVMDFPSFHCRERQLLSALAENESLKVQLDEARAGCVVWEGVVSILEAHLLDRIAMKDESQPDIYLSILQSGVANVTRDTEQIREATWHRERLYAARAEKAEAERNKALEVIREYRQLHSKELGCFGGFNELSSVLYADKRCPTCVKADELRKVKEEEIGE